MKKMEGKIIIDVSTNVKLLKRKIKTPVRKTIVPKKRLPLIVVPKEIKTRLIP